MTQLRRKHLAPGTYFVWRCKHRNGTQDRASDRNDGPDQEDCEVELIEKPDYAHIRTVAHIEISEVVSRVNAAQEEVSAQLQRIVAELSAARVPSLPIGLQSRLALKHDQKRAKVISIAKRVRGRNYSVKSTLDITDRILFDELNQAIDDYIAHAGQEPSQPTQGGPAMTPE